jgi:hypothetical protein
VLVYLKAHAYLLCRVSTLIVSKAADRLDVYIQLVSHCHITLVHNNSLPPILFTIMGVGVVVFCDMVAYLLLMLLDGPRKGGSFHVRTVRVRNHNMLLAALL